MDLCRFRSAIGSENDLVNWMGQMESNRSELRELFDLNQARTDAKFEAFEARTDARFSSFESRIDARFARFETMFERKHADLLKWSFLFWVSAVASIAALAKVLR